MDKRLDALIGKLAAERSLTLEEYAELIETRTPEAASRLAELAVAERRRWYGDKVFTRGLIEISNFCKNDCYYCGIRRSNRNADRYRLTPEDILACCAEGYALGFRTFVLQGGEDGYYSDDVLCPLIGTMKERWPDCAVTLSLGERSRESYRGCLTPGRTAICSATRPRTGPTTGSSTRRRCPSRTGCAACST